MYPRPFFISPHALQQFRKRFSLEYSDQEIQQLLNDQLQPPKLPDAVHINMKRGEPALYYGIIVDSIPSTAVVVAPPGADITIRRRPDEWPVVATLYPGRKHIVRFHKRLTAIRCSKPKHARWEEWEIQSVRLMRWIGYTQPQIGQVMQMTVRQVERYAPKLKPYWTNEEMQLMCDLRAQGKTFKEIAKVLGRSENAVKAKMLRHRAWVLSDPERVVFLHIMHLLQNPGKLLRYLRRVDMAALAAKILEEEGVPYADTDAVDLPGLSKHS